MTTHENHMEISHIHLAAKGKVQLNKNQTDKYKSIFQTLATHITYTEDSSTTL